MPSSMPSSRRHARSCVSRTDVREAVFEFLVRCIGFELPAAFEQCLALIATSFLSIERVCELLNHLELVLVQAEHLPRPLLSTDSAPSSSSSSPSASMTAPLLQLLEDALLYACHNAQALVNTRSFQTLSTKNLVRLLEHPYFAPPEIELFRACVAWAASEVPREPPRSFESLKYLIRFPLLTAQMLADEVQPSGLLSAAELCELYTYLLTANRDTRAFTLPFSTIQRIPPPPTLPAHVGASTTTSVTLNQQSQGAVLVSASVSHSGYAASVPPRSGVLLVSSNAQQLAQLQSDLSGVPRIQALGTVATFNVADASLTWETVSQYAAVVLWVDLNPNPRIAQREELGSVLYRYVCSHGGLVVCDLDGIGLGEFDAVNPLTRQGLRTGQRDALGKLLVPGHELLADVAQFAGMSFIYNEECTPNRTEHMHGRVIAEWESGAPLVAESWMPADEEQASAPTQQMLRVVSLNFFVPGAAANLWDADTDGMVLVCNAIEYVARPRDAAV